MNEEKNTISLADNAEPGEESIIISDNGEEVPVAKAEHHHHHHHHHRHHHSHDHHSHHRRRSSKSGSKRGNKLSRFLKKNKKKVLYVSLSLIFVVVLAVVGSFIDVLDYSNAGKTSSSNVASQAVITIAPFKEDVVIVGPVVEEFVKGYPNTLVTELYHQYKNDKNRLDIGLPVRVKYSLSVDSGEKVVKSVSLKVGENENLSKLTDCVIKQGDGFYDIYYLKCGTKYYYQLSVVFSDGSISGAAGSFKTAQMPRVLSVEGVGNMRDIGGYKTAGGKRVKQGLLYRGCEIDGAIKPQYSITQEGIKTMLTVLGIRTDMDLRNKGEISDVVDPLGAGVKHEYYNSYMYADAFSPEGKAVIKRVFSDLAKRENYPIYMHCTNGVDRTGTVCYLLGALLGVDEKDLMLDYQLSGLFHGEMWGEKDMKIFASRLNLQVGENLSQKAENLLLSAGVTAKEIANIKTIFLG